ncbi:MAG: hypothetical protein Q9181_006771 [Wetmoreana brouardii]
MHDSGKSGATQLSNVGLVFFQARVKLDTLDNLISKWAKIDAWGDSVHIGKIDRFFWLKERTRVWELQKQLRGIRQGLCVLLGAGNASALAQLSVDIQRLYTETIRTSDAQSKSQAVSQKFFEAISRRMDSIEEIHRNSQDSVKLLQDLCLSLAAEPVQETQQDTIQVETSDLARAGPVALSSALQDIEAFNVTLASRSPAKTVWRNILQLRSPPQAAEALSLLFSKEDYLEGRRFNRLHRLVNGLERGDLAAELVSGTVSDIDGRDVDGWTALHWAARRGSSEAVALLLAHGADPRLITWTKRRSALHLAASSNSAPCVQQILQWRRGNAIVDLEPRDVRGCTPLHAASASHGAATTASLINSSADLNAREDFGFTPLLLAIHENKVEAASVLLRHGADYTIASKAGNTILHVAANVATIPMLVVLAKARMRGLDLKAQDPEGLTVAELIALRDGEEPEAFFRAFDRLLRSIVDEDFEVGSWTSISSAESWHSVEDARWYETEASAIVEADVAG